MNSFNNQQFYHKSKRSFIYTINTINTKAGIKHKISWIDGVKHGSSIGYTLLNIERYVAEGSWIFIKSNNLYQIY